MKPINKILFPTDFSNAAQNAFQYCLFLAEQYGAQVKVLHVVYPEYSVADLPLMAAQSISEDLKRAKDRLDNFVKKGVEAVKEQFGTKKMPEINSEIEIGGPVQLIVEVAKRECNDLIVMGTTGTHSAIEKFMGSVTTGVIGKSCCHVWVIPEEASFKEIKSVVYATELKFEEPFHIYQAGRLLAPFNALVHCVHVYTDESASKVDFSSLETAFKEKAEGSGLELVFHALKGLPVSDRLKLFVEKEKVEVLVMYAPFHSFWSKLFNKSRTKTMAFKTKTPLLLIRDKKQAEEGKGKA